MFESTLNQTAFTCIPTKFDDRSNIATEIQFIEDATSNCLFTISKTAEDTGYKVKNLSEAPILFKEERLQKDEERPLALGELIKFEIPQDGGRMKDFSYVFWPMKCQEELLRREIDAKKAGQDEKKCAKCLKYLYRCVVVAPCYHNFCSFCLSKHLEENLKDPACLRCGAKITRFEKKMIGHKLSDPESEVSEEEKKKMDSADMILKGAKLKRYGNGSFYFGFLKDNKREGKGKFVDSQGNVYDGKWKDDKKEGEGEWRKENGEKYEGDWKGDKKNGYGYYKLANGDKYRGQFVDDKFNGKGKVSFKNGDEYDGGWKNDNFDGDGEFTFANGDKYKGKFKNNKIEGQGELIYANEDVYKGEFKDNMKHGHGEYIYKDGTRYKGDYKDGTRQGKGEIIYANGDRYIGEWKNGMRNGYGKLIRSGGSKEVGLWKDDQFQGDVKEKKQKVDDAKKERTDDAKTVEKTPKDGKSGVWNRMFGSLQKSGEVSTSSVKKTPVESS